MEIIILIIFLLCVLGVLYISLVFYLHDLSINPLNIATLKEKRVLFIFAHPDDETMTSGGLLALLVQNAPEHVFAISVTAGEKGIEKLNLEPDQLGPIRKKEYAHALQRLGVRNSEVWSFPDGDILTQSDELRDRIQTFVLQQEIQVVVTHEKFGLYGHPDHIALSKIINQLARQLNFEALYSTLPNKILARIKLPKTLTYKDKMIELTPEVVTNPQYKVNIFSTLLQKFQAAKEYKSQDLEHGIPLIILMAFGGFEYYTYEYPENTL